MVTLKHNISILLISFTLKINFRAANNDLQEGSVYVYIYIYIYIYIKRVCGSTAGQLSFLIAWICSYSYQNSASLNARN